MLCVSLLSLLTAFSLPIIINHTIDEDSALAEYVNSELKDTHLNHIYRERFHDGVRGQRMKVWEEICKHWIQHYIPANASVLDLAAGYCEFINQIQAAQKIAVDLNEDVLLHANPDVRVVLAYSHDMQGVGSDSVDIVFVSNFFEHLPTKQAFLDTLTEIKRVLKVGGRVLILQPNIRFLAGAYWDFIDHHLPLTDRTVAEALNLVGMQIEEVRPRFLPYTTRSHFPQNRLLVRLYLKLPFAHWIFGKQAWVVASKV